MTTVSTTVVVQYHPHGHWEIMRPDRHPITCETLDDARRIAYLSVAHAHRRELIVRDAYCRVIDHELIDPDARGPAGLRGE
jgi:hypothetical protein